MSVDAELHTALTELLGFEPGSDVAERLRSSDTRIRKGYREIFRGYALTGDAVLNEVSRVEGYSGIVSVLNVAYYSFCEHHFLPVLGWLFTALAASLGAPFWFDLLKKAANLRATGPNPDEKKATRNTA